MIARTRVKALLKEAEDLAAALRRYRTPGSNDPVDPTRVAELSRYLAMVRDAKQLGEFLGLLPTSYHTKVSKSAGPQLREIARVVRPLLDKIVDPDELLYVLGWAHRLMATEERGTGMGVERATAGPDASSAERRQQHGRPGNAQGNRTPRSR